MKRGICMLAALVMLSGTPCGAFAQQHTLTELRGQAAQEYVSISELYNQAQSMGGWWKETFDTPNGQVTVDAPIIVPDIEEIPVITVEAAKMSETVYNQIQQGNKTKRRELAFEYEVELNGKEYEFFFGNVKPEEQGYETIQTVWIQHGGYRFNDGTGTMGEASPVTYHYPWQLDSEQSYLRGSEQTISDVMRIWQEEIDLCYGSKYEIHPKRIEIYGSTLEENKGTDKASKRIGYYSIDAEQYLEGLPVFGSIANNQNHGFAIGFTSDIDSNHLEEEMDQYRQASQEACRLFLRTISTNGLDNRNMTELIDVRTMEYNDVPLASLEDVLGEIKEEIEKGHIRELYSIRLGYMLYSNPDMTDYAWAIPRWVIDCNYVTNENEEMVEDFHEMDDGWMNIWNVFEFTQMPVDAQTGELIIFTTGDKKTFSVPDIITWDDVQRAV